MNVNKHLLPVKGAYFCYYGGLATLFPYIGVFMKALGLTPTEAGIIVAVRVFLGACMRPVTGYAADRFKKHKTIVIISLILCILIDFVLYFTPETHTINKPENKTDSFSFHCFRNDTFDRLSAINISSEDFLIRGNCVTSCILCDGTINLTQTCSSNGDTSLSNLQDKELSVNDSFTIRPIITSIHEDDLMNNLSKTNSLISNLNISHDGMFFQKMTCNEDSKIVCEVKCENNPTESSLVENEVQSAFSITFYFFLIFYSLNGMISEPISSLLDAIVYNHLGEARNKWGEQRMWGTIGFSVFALISGVVMYLSSIDHGQKQSYLPAFIGFFILLMISAFITWTYSMHTSQTDEIIAHNRRHLFKNVNLLVTFIIVFIFGIFYGVHDSILFWHLHNLGGTQLLMGVSLLLTCSLEIPVLYLSGSIIKKIGAENCICMVWIAYAVRFIYYSYLSKPWLVLVIEPIHCITFALMYAAVTSSGSSATPDGFHGSVQGMISALYNGGRGIGSLMIGPVFEKYGAFVAFFSCGIVSLVLFILHFTYKIIRSCTDKKPYDQSKNTDDVKLDTDSTESNEIQSRESLINQSKR